MPDRTEYEKRRDANAEPLAAVHQWWLRDCDLREQTGAFGEQVIRIVWEAGRVVVYHVEPRLTGKPGRPGFRRAGVDDDGGGRE